MPGKITPFKTIQLLLPFALSAFVQGTALAKSESYKCVGVAGSKKIGVLLEKQDNGRVLLSKIESKKGFTDFIIQTTDNEAKFWNIPKLKMDFAVDCCEAAKDTYCIGKTPKFYPYSMMRTVEQVKGERGIKVRLIYSNGVKQKATKNEIATLIQIAPVNLQGEPLDFQILEASRNNNLLATFNDKSLRMDCEKLGFLGKALSK